MGSFGPVDPSDELNDVSQHVMQMVGNLWQWHYGDFSPNDSWSPAVNVYRLKDRIEVCMDLSGVDKREVDVRVQPGQLTIKGIRHAPDPLQEGDESLRILSMEIDHGPFCRTVPLPETVNLDQVTSRYQEGMLWVTLPMVKPRRRTSK